MKGFFAALLMVVSFMWFASAEATTLTFSPGPFGPFGPGTPTTEGIFTYDAKSGVLFKEQNDGNPAPDMEGSSTATGGVLKIFRNDVAEGLFTFDQSDIRFEFDSVMSITFEGFLASVSQGVDVFSTSGDSSWTTAVASTLSGKLIDELDVTLIASSTTAADIDNVVLTSRSTVPEPITMLLLGIGLTGVLGLRRKLS